MSLPLINIGMIYTQVRSFQCYPNRSDWLNGIFLENAFSKSFKLEASPVEGQLPSQKDKQKRKKKGEKKKTELNKEKQKAIRRRFDKILISAHARAKML